MRSVTEPNVVSWYDGMLRITKPTSSLMLFTFKELFILHSIHTALIQCLCTTSQNLHVCIANTQQL